MSRFLNYYKQTLTYENMVSCAVFGIVYQGVATTNYQINTNQPLDSSIWKNMLIGGVAGPAIMVTWPISVPATFGSFVRDVYNYRKK